MEWGIKKDTEEEVGKQRGRRAVCGHNGEPGTGSIPVSIGRIKGRSQVEKSPLKGSALYPLN